MFNRLFAQSGFTLDRLRTFCEVAEAGGMTKAAGGKQSRQGQFSRQVKELEMFFGTELLRRQGKTIRLSPAGVRLVKLARECFSAFDDFYGDCKGEPIECSIGAGDALLQWLLFPHLAQLRDAFPRVAFHLLSLPTLDIVERVNDLRLDFGLVRKDAVSPLQKAELLGTQTYSLFVPIRLLGSRKRGDWREVMASVPLATIGGEGAFRANLDKEATKRKLRVNFSLSCSTFPEVAKALQSDKYAAILPSIAAAELDHSRFAIIAAPFLRAQDREIYLVWNPRITHLRPTTLGVKDRLAKLLKLPTE
jgi:DNA-binding transcriptional LysR family regulator